MSFLQPRNLVKKFSVENAPGGLHLSSTEKLVYHDDIIHISHRVICVTCQQAFIAMSMIVDLSMEDLKSES